MKKYAQGETIKTAGELIAQEFVMFRGKVYHRGWFRSWQFGWVMAKLLNAEIFKVIPSATNKKYPVVIRFIRDGGFGDNGIVGKTARARIIYRDERKIYKVSSASLLLIGNDDDWGVQEEWTFFPNEVKEVT